MVYASNCSADQMENPACRLRVPVKGESPVDQLSVEKKKSAATLVARFVRPLMVYAFKNTVDPKKRLVCHPRE
jgi:hypothetical protein